MQWGNKEIIIAAMGKYAEFATELIKDTERFSYEERMLWIE